MTVTALPLSRPGHLVQRGCLASGRESWILATPSRGSSPQPSHLPKSLPPRILFRSRTHVHVASPPYLHRVRHGFQTFDVWQHLVAMRCRRSWSSHPFERLASLPPAAARLAGHGPRALPKSGAAMATRLSSSGLTCPERRPAAASATASRHRGSKKERAADLTS
jgi:hypothetical protein